MKLFQRFFLLILSFNLFSFFQCDTEYYDGSERIIIEGRFQLENQPLADQRIEIYATGAQATSAEIVSLVNDPYNYIQGTEYPIAVVNTDHTGFVQMSIPKHTTLDTYIIVIKGNNYTKTFGYISPLNIRNYRINLGTLHL